MNIFSIMELIKEPAVINNGNHAIGVWTAAHLLQEWGAHRAELYLL
jgi:hypothetical protein